MGVLLASLGVPGGSSGGPRMSLGRRQKGSKTQKVLSECLGWPLGGPCDDFGGLWWCLGPAQVMQMLIFHVF